MSKRVPIKAAAKMKALMTSYYGDAKSAETDPDRKIAWITSGGPVEILRAAGVIPVYPENHVALCGTAHMADALCAAAEGQGYSRDLCSCARTDFGVLATGESPIGGVPKPDFLVCCNNICSTVAKWYQELQRIFDVPLIFIDAPFQYALEDQVDAIDYVEAQLNNMMLEVGEIVGQPIDQGELRETLDRSDKAMALWRAIQELLAHRPAPMDTFDTFIHLAPIVTLRGTRECVEYYEDLLSEMRERVRNGVAAVEGEQYRLGWDNLAIWHKVHFLAERFATHNAALVASTCTNSFCYRAADRDPGQPLRAMAADYLGGYINHGLDFREQELASMIERFQLDGFVMHSNRSCRAYSLGQYELARCLEENHGVPTLIIEADQNDTRAWSDEQTATRIDAFMETISAHAKQSGQP